MPLDDTIPKGQPPSGGGRPATPEEIYKILRIEVCKRTCPMIDIVSHPPRRFQRRRRLTWGAVIAGIIVIGLVLGGVGLANSGELEDHDDVVDPGRPTFRT